eukprot:gene12405-19183_t
MVPVSQWCVGDVVYHLSKGVNGATGWAEAAFLRTIEEHEIDGPALLELNKDDLRYDFHIKELGRIKRILRGIAAIDLAFGEGRRTEPARAVWNCEGGGRVPHLPQVDEDAPSSEDQACSREHESSCSNGSGDHSPQRRGSPARPAFPPAAPPPRPPPGPGRHQSPAPDPFPAGILERERRYAELVDLHGLWAAVDPSPETPPTTTTTGLPRRPHTAQPTRTPPPEGRVALPVVSGALRAYFGWSEAEAAAALDHSPQWPAEGRAASAPRAGRLRHKKQEPPGGGAGLASAQFVGLVSLVTDAMSPACFDGVMRHLKSSVRCAAGAVEARRKERLARELFCKWDYPRAHRIAKHAFRGVLALFAEGAAGDQGEPPRSIPAPAAGQRGRRAEAGAAVSDRGGAAASALGSNEGNAAVSDPSVAPGGGPEDTAASAQVSDHSVAPGSGQGVAGTSNQGGPAVSDQEVAAAGGPGDTALRDSEGPGPEVTAESAAVDGAEGGQLTTAVSDRNAPADRACSQGDSLTEDDFVQAILDLWQDADSKEFDLNYFRLNRIVQDTIVSAGQPSDKALTANDISTIAATCGATTPIVFYGTSADPSRAVEEAAAEAGTVLKPFLVTHLSVEVDALDAVAKFGVVRGFWVYLVLGASYNADSLFRELGRKLQTTNGWMVHHKFRLL